MVAKSTATASRPLRNAIPTQRKQVKAPTPQVSQPRPTLPDEGFVRLPQVLTVIPVSKSHWWSGIQAGKFPKGVKLGPKLTAWRVEDIRALIAGDAANDTTVGGR